MDIDNKNPQNPIATQPNQDIPPVSNSFLHKIKLVTNRKNLIITAIFIIVCVISYVTFWVILNYPKSLRAETGRNLSW